MQIYLELVSKLKSNNESMIKKNMKTTNPNYGTKSFPKIKVFFSHTPLKLHVYNDMMVFISSSSPKIFLKKNCLMFYSNSNDDKKYVIQLQFLQRNDWKMFNWPRSSLRPAIENVSHKIFKLSTLRLSKIFPEIFI